MRWTRIGWRKCALLALAVLLALPGTSEARRQGQGNGDEPGAFDYYALTLSWSPTYCADLGRRDGGPQCNGPRPYAFVLHGLWPQRAKGWPEFCDTGGRPWVPQRTIDDMLDIMPSRQLIIHEYKKHGTCSGLSAERYFDTARKLYTSIKIPERYQLPQRPLRLSPGEVVSDFLAANPGLKPEMISIACDDRLQELRICFGRDLRPSRCGSNETARKLCSRDAVTLPPVRQGRF